MNMEWPQYDDPYRKLYLNKENKCAQERNTAGKAGVLSMCITIEHRHLLAITFSGRTTRYLEILERHLL